jgi:hypothetical protein
MARTKSKVNVRIGFSHGGQGKVRNPIHISIEDVASGVQMIEVEFTPEQFALALGSQMMTGLPVELGDLTLVGCTYEHKEVVVEVPERMWGIPLEMEKQARDAVRPHEVDGWMGRLEDVNNHHRRVDDTHRRVTFTRFVDPDGEPRLPARRMSTDRVEALVTAVCEVLGMDADSLGKTRFKAAVDAARKALRR